MKWSIKLVLTLTIGTVAIAGTLVSCGPSNAGHGGGASGGTGGGGTGGTGGGAGGSGGPCVGLQCQQVTCMNGGSTTLTGKVFAPEGTLPLYNATVYVPNTTPAAFTEGVTCDRCGSAISGSPVVITQTDASGSFSLTNVPVGANIPLVVQMGKWRRQVTIPSVPECMTTALDMAVTRLPKNRSEGDIPQMAIATGSADPFECLLLKLGIDPAEITSPLAATPGRIHFYTGATSKGTDLSSPAPKEDDATNGLYTNIAKLMKYDVVMLPCEGTANYSKTTDPQRALLVQYLNAGGRLFSTHYSYQWLTYTNSPFNVVGDMWVPDQPNPATPYTGTLDTSFPKGAAFSMWLTNVTTNPKVMGSFEVVDPRHDLDKVNAMYGQRWVYHAGDDQTEHMTFNTPLDAPKNDMGEPQYCGRVVFSDFHVSATARSGSTFPAACKSEALTTQEKALAFMLFDLSSCVQSDQTQPIP